MLEDNKHPVRDAVLIAAFSALITALIDLFKKEVEERRKKKYGQETSIKDKTD